MQVVANAEGVKAAAKKAAALAASVLVAGVSRRSCRDWGGPGRSRRLGGGTISVGALLSSRGAQPQQTAPRRAMLTILVPMRFLPPLQSANALSFDELQGLTYLQVKGSGIANTCPTLGSGSSNIKDLKAGSYKLEKFCMEPTSFTVKEESQVSSAQCPSPQKLRQEQCRAARCFMCASECGAAAAACNIGPLASSVLLTRTLLPDPSSAVQGSGRRVRAHQADDPSDLHPGRGGFCHVDVTGEVRVSMLKCAVECQPAQRHSLAW